MAELKMPCELCGKVKILETDKEYKKGAVASTICPRCFYVLHGDLYDANEIKDEIKNMLMEEKRNRVVWEKIEEEIDYAKGHIDERIFKAREKEFRLLEDLILQETKEMQEGKERMGKKI